MQPVSDNRSPYQIIPARTEITGQRENSPISVKGTYRKNVFILPEDIVTLSRERFSNLDPSIRKKPSIPVSADETKALRDSFSVYV